MTRLRIALAVLIAFIDFTTTESIGFDWNFLNHDDDSVPDSSAKLTEPPALSSSSLHDDTSSSADIHAKSAAAISTIRSTYRNWVGPWKMSPDTACYRQAHIMNVCPDNFDRNEVTNTCWAECPVEYPVECGMECIRQNDDCGIEVTSKVSAVAMTVFSSATFGVFGELAKLGKTISRAVRCTNSMMLVMRGILRYIRTMKAEDPQASDRKMLILLYQTSTVVTDLPIAITVCMGKPVPSNLRMSQYVLSTAQWVLMQALANNASIISNWQHFKAFLTGANFTEAAVEITEGEISSLETAMKQNSSCGGDLMSLTGRVWLTVNGYREDVPGITDDEIRLKISDSDLVKYDVPTVTNNCMQQMVSESNVATAYTTRETLRKTFGVIINDLIKSGKSDNGTSLEEKERAFRTIDMGFSTLAATLMDPTRITLLLSEFIQTICGPTQFMGEIDDGTEAATLGLNTLEDAFKGSSSSWTKKGDGVVIINFTSTDEKDVSVNIMSGGDKVDEVAVNAGETVQWKSSIQVLGGKTLYLDRWRPGFLGLPGKGGGSLVLWVPKGSQGGHLEIDAKLNVS
ncbi:hypothetical protein DD238_005954 [Peronospora effusa]|uniref:CBM20 domain-containing protein n=1 Tax=Peronospora effusa TaxID=542832 RepID=A0A3M6VR10_9STRA|nr:hypothetical protein DD238_005954 [Peronospora effusa]RQM17938.1 hypothetical protein DD237_002641 [Peronospora effusa]